MDTASPSSHLQAQRLAPQNVEMQVGDGLPGISSAVGDYPVAVFQSLCLCNFGDHCKNVGNHSAVFLRDPIH